MYNTTRIRRGEAGMHYETGRILEALSMIRITKAMPEEYEIHDAVGAVLAAAGLGAEHEVRIAPRCRIDFLCGDTGIEIKKGKVTRVKLMGQCARYLASEKLSSLIVIAPFPPSLPGAIEGKSVTVFSLARLWGLAV